MHSSLTSLLLHDCSFSRGSVIFHYLTTFTFTTESSVAHFDSNKNCSDYENEIHESDNDGPHAGPDPDDVVVQKPRRHSTRRRQAISSSEEESDRESSKAVRSRSLRKPPPPTTTAHHPRLAKTAAVAKQLAFAEAAAAAEAAEVEETESAAEPETPAEEDDNSALDDADTDSGMPRAKVTPLPKRKTPARRTIKGTSVTAEMRERAAGKKGNESDESTADEMGTRGRKTTAQPNLRQPTIPVVSPNSSLFAIPPAPTAVTPPPFPTPSPSPSPSPSPALEIGAVDTSPDDDTIISRGARAARRTKQRKPAKRAAEPRRQKATRGKKELISPPPPPSTRAGPPVPQAPPPDADHSGTETPAEDSWTDEEAAAPPLPRPPMSATTAPTPSTPASERAGAETATPRRPSRLILDDDDEDEDEDRSPATTPMAATPKSSSSRRSARKAGSAKKPKKTSQKKSPAPRRGKPLTATPLAAAAENPLLSPGALIPRGPDGAALPAEVVRALEADDGEESEEGSPSDEGENGGETPRPATGYAVPPHIMAMMMKGQPPPSYAHPVMTPPRPGWPAGQLLAATASPSRTGAIPLPPGLIPVTPTPVTSTPGVPLGPLPPGTVVRSFPGMTKEQALALARTRPFSPPAAYPMMYPGYPVSPQALAALQQQWRSGMPFVPMSPGHAAAKRTRQPRGKGGAGRSGASRRGGGGRRRRGRDEEEVSPGGSPSGESSTESAGAFSGVGGDSSGDGCADSDSEGSGSGSGAKGAVDTTCIPDTARDTEPSVSRATLARSLCCHLTFERRHSSILFTAFLGVLALCPLRSKKSWAVASSSRPSGHPAPAARPPGRRARHHRCREERAPRVMRRASSISSSGTCVHTYTARGCRVTTYYRVCVPLLPPLLPR